LTHSVVQIYKEQRIVNQTQQIFVTENLQQLNFSGVIYAWKWLKTVPSNRM